MGLDIRAYFTTQEWQQLEDMPVLTPKEEEKMRKIARHIAMRMREKMKSDSIKIH